MVSTLVAYPAEARIGRQPDHAAPVRAGRVRVRGEGSVVLHFHGGNVGHNGWFFLEHLVRAGYQVLTPDRPGYLGTPIEHGGSPEQQADLAAALLDALGIQRVPVVGISAGGPVAIQFAARHADRVDALAAGGQGSIAGTIGTVGVSNVDLASNRP
ncbi:MAG: alpha/beta fold hydrolase [bacterium]